MLLGVFLLAAPASAQQGGPVYKLEWLNAWYEGSTATLPKTITPDSLSITPGMNYPTVQRLQFTFSFSGEEESVVPANTVEIRIPASIYKDATGAPAELLTTVPLPMNTSFNYWKDPATNEYVIYNFTEISEALVFTLQLDYKVRPSNVRLPSAPGEAIAPYTNQIQAQVTIKRPNMPPAVDTTNALDFTYITDSKLSSVTKSVPSSSNYFATWPSGWGAAPADAADYFYVSWRIRVNVPGSNTQSHFVSLTDTPTAADGGQVVGWYMPVTGTVFANRDDGWDNNLAEFNAAATNAVRVATPYTSSTYYDNYLHMRYPRSLLEPSADGTAMQYSVTNKAAAELIGDYGAADYKEGAGSFLYREVPWKPAPGSYATKTALGASPGMIDRLEKAWLAGQTGALSFHPNASYTWYVSSAQEDWRRTQDASGTYGVVPWTAYHLDNQFSFDTYEQASTAYYYPLGAGDYALTRLTLYQPNEQIYGEPNPFGGNTLIPQTPDKYGQVTVQVTTVQNPGESDWITIGTSRLNPELNTGWTYTPVTGDPVVMGQNYTYPVDLTAAVPGADVLGVRMLQNTTAARVNQGYTLLMNLYPSKRVIDGLRPSPARTGDIRSSVNVYNAAYNWATGGAIAADSTRARVSNYLNINRQSYFSYHYKGISTPYIDYNARHVRLPVTLYAYNYTPFPAGTTQAEALAMDLLQQQTEGIF